VSVSTDLVEGGARRTTGHDVHLSRIALGSASEVRFQLGLAKRLDLFASSESDKLVARGPRPEAGGLRPENPRCGDVIVALPYVEEEQRSQRCGGPAKCERFFGTMY